MKNIVLLIISMSANLFGGIIKKHINNNYQNNMFSYQFYNAVVSLVSMIVLFIMADSIKVSLFTVVLAFLFGFITLIQQISNLYALEIGPFSYTTVIISLSTLIPTLSGAIFWDEKIAVAQFIGIALLIVCFFCSVEFKNKTEKSGIKWLLFSLIAFVCTGLIGVMQKFHQKSDYSSELNGFLILAFLFSFVCSSVIAILTYLRNRNIEDVITKPSTVKLIPIVLMIISGIFVALNNKFNLYLSGVMDSAVFFPLVNGGGLILSTVAAFIIFKEKLSLKQWVGIIIGTVSVILICNPF